MKDAGYVVAAAFVVTWAVTWLLGRFFESRSETFAAINLIVSRTCLALILSLVAAEAAASGGYAWIAVAFLVPLALFNFFLAGGFIWLWATRGLDDIDSPAHSQSE